MQSQAPLKHLNFTATGFDENYLGAFNHEKGDQQA
jgi:hypothetical protein